MHAGENLSVGFSLCIKHLPEFFSVRRSVCFLNVDWTIREHLSYALPTELIFYLLRSIPSVRLTSDYSPESMLDMLEIVIKWHQVSAAECNR